MELEILKPDLSTEAGIKEWAGKLTQGYNELVERQKAGVSVTREEWDKHNKAFEEMVKAQANLMTIVKANAGSFPGGNPTDRLLIERENFVLDTEQLEKDYPELRGMNRDYFNVVALSAEELYGASQVGPMRIRQMSKGVQRWLESPGAQHTLLLKDELDRENDMMIALDTIMCGPNGRTTYAQLGPPAVRMKTLKRWKRWEKISSEFSRALSTTGAATGAEWVPTIMSSSFQDLVELPLRVMSLFRTIPLPSKSYDWPVKTARGRAYLVGEGTAEANPLAQTFTPSTMATGKITFTAVKLGVLQVVSAEEDEDSIVPALQTMLEDTAGDLGHGMEDATINGEFGGATMDTATFNPAGDQRRAWYGLRWYAIGVAANPADVSMGNAVVAANSLIAVQKAMGVFGATPTEFAWISGFTGYHSLRKSADFQTFDKLGPFATLIPGQVGSILGSPVVLSEKVVDLNASGKYDGTTTDRGTILGVYPRAFARGSRRAMTIDVDYSLGFRSDQILVRGTTRDDFKPFFTIGATVAPVGALYNIAA